ncbi:MAG: cell wall hydrolase [Ruminococcus sp.]|nr:cell wall hydrolase [Ruminococcus sp.]
MGLNNRKSFISKVLTVCIIANLMSSSNIMVSATTTEAPTQQDDITVTTNTSPLDTDNLATETQTSIIKKLDFEYEIQSMIERYKNIQEAEKTQARLDTLDFIDRLIESSDYSVDEKRELYSTTLSSAILNNIITVRDSINIKRDCELALNKQSDAENLNLTIEKILNSSVSIDSKKSFCLNSLELANLSGTISDEEYETRINEVQTTLDNLQQEEEKKKAEEKAIQLAKEKEAEEKAIQEAQQQAQQQTTDETVQSVTTVTTDTTVDVSNLQTVSDAQESSSNLGFNGTLTYTDKDFLALVNVVQHEVGNCSTLSKQMVASVIINRALSDIFPSSMYDVVNQTNQFTGMQAYIDRTDYATEDTIYWCQYVLDNGIDYSNGALFYYAPQWCGYMSYFESMTLVAEHDGQRYFK